MFRIYRWLFRKALRSVILHRFFRILDGLNAVRLPRFGVNLRLMEPLEQRLVPSHLSMAGVILVEYQGYEFNGTVASVGVDSSASDMSGAVIQWGDGTLTSGIIVADSFGSDICITGTHTYQHPGNYVLAVGSAQVPSLGSESFAVGIGLAVVIAPTDHTGLEKINSVSIPDPQNLDDIVSYSDDGYSFSGLGPELPLRLLRIRDGTRWHL